METLIGKEYTDSEGHKCGSHRDDPEPAEYLAMRRPFERPLRFCVDTTTSTELPRYRPILWTYLLGGESRENATIWQNCRWTTAALLPDTILRHQPLQGPVSRGPILEGLRSECLAVEDHLIDPFHLPMKEKHKPPREELRASKASSPIQWKIPSFSGSVIAIDEPITSGQG